MKFFCKLISCILLSLSISGCDIGLGLSATSVSNIIKNPRVYEGELISVVGRLEETENSLRLLNINYKLVDTKLDQSIYLQNMIAKVDTGVEVIVKGTFSTLTIPVYGPFLVLDSKSVQACTKLSFC